MWLISRRRGRDSAPNARRSPTRAGHAPRRRLGGAEAVLVNRTRTSRDGACRRSHRRAGADLRSARDRPTPGQASRRGTARGCSCSQFLSVSMRDRASPTPIETMVNSTVNSDATAELTRPWLR